MGRKRKDRTFSERLYKANVLPDGNLKSVDLIDVVLKKIEDPPIDNDENGNGTV